MFDRARTRIRERIAAGATLEEIEHLIRASRGLTEDERAALWIYAWHYDPAQDPAHVREAPPPEPALQPLG